MTKDTIGIDVSKATLDVFCNSTRTAQTLPNSEEGFAQLCNWLGQHRDTLIVFEATGAYHRGLERYLSKVGKPFVKVNPKQARRFAEAIGKLAKTDIVDARMLARMGSVLDLSPQHTDCWVHKTMNVLNAMPKSVQPKAKGHLHDIWQAETRDDAEKAFDFFVTAYGVKYEKAVGKLVKDRVALLTFYDFPAEHWKHIRTTNPIESTFATVRHRTRRTKGSLGRKTGLAMTFKLMMSAQRKWRSLDGRNRLPQILQGVAFSNGIAQLQAAA